MTFEQVIAFLERYPCDHQSKVSIGRVQGAFNVIKVLDGPGTAGQMRDVLAVMLQRGEGLPVKVLPFHKDAGEVFSISAHLLRAWLGPVPVVLPDGCSVDDGTRIWGDGDASVAFTGTGGLHIRWCGAGVVISAETLAWLRGEVTP